MTPMRNRVMVRRVLDSRTAKLMAGLPVPEVTAPIVAALPAPRRAMAWLNATTARPPTTQP